MPVYLFYIYFLIQGRCEFYNIAFLIQIKNFGRLDVIFSRTDTVLYVIMCHYLQYTLLTAFQGRGIYDIY